VAVSWVPGCVWGNVRAKVKNEVRAGGDFTSHHLLGTMG